MTADDNVTSAGESSVGGWLRSAREAAGLSEDAVAQQLKLAPRQVRAIEEDDYARLPGRTFVRGFVRNYARLVHLDPDAVVAALPVGESTSPLERLTYSPSGPRDEMPMESPRRGGRTARWVIPLVLLAVVGVAVYFEFVRSPAQRPPVPDGIMPPPPAKATTPSGPTSVPLPNPFDAPKGEAPPPPQSAAPNAVPPVASDAAKSAVTPSSPPPAPASSPAAAAVATPVVASSTTTSTAAPAATAAPAIAASPVVAGDPPLILTFSGTSWVQVKDASGAVVLSQTATSGTTLPVAGTPPLDVVVGNADHVKARFRGESIDLAAHTRLNVARVTLR